MYMVGKDVNVILEAQDDNQHTFNGQQVCYHGYQAGGMLPWLPGRRYVTMVTRQQACYHGYQAVGMLPWLPGSMLVTVMLLHDLNFLRLLRVLCSNIRFDYHTTSTETLEAAVLQCGVSLITSTWFT